MFRNVNGLQVQNLGVKTCLYSWPLLKLYVASASVSGVRKTFQIPSILKLKARGGIVMHSNLEFESKDLLIVSGILKPIVSITQKTPHLKVFS